MDMRMGSVRAPWSLTIQSGLGRCYEVSYTLSYVFSRNRLTLILQNKLYGKLRACPPYAGPQHCKAPTQLG